MRIVRVQIDRTADRPDPSVDHIHCRQETAIEGRLLLNRFEAKLLDGALWVRNWWFETTITAVGRFLCRHLRRHNVTCRGRNDHTGREPLGWPRA